MSLCGGALIPLQRSALGDLPAVDAVASNSTLYRQSGTSKVNYSLGVSRFFDVRGVVFLDHLDAGPAVFGDLIDVGPFHQAHTDVGVPQAVGRAAVAVTVEF